MNRFKEFQRYVLLLFHGAVGQNVVLLAVAALFLSRAGKAQQIAITFDDLPAHGK